MSKLTVFASCLALCVVFLNCNDSNKSNPTSPSGIKDAYSVSGNTLVLHIPAGTENYCDSNYLMISPADSSVMQFEISGNTLETFDPPDTNYYEYSDPNLILQTYDVFTRVSGGPGLTGVWSLTSEGDSVLRGALTTTEKAQLDSENSLQGSMSVGNMEVEFTGNTVIIQYSYAELFTTEWTSVYGNGSADSLLAITLSQVNGNTVRMTGAISGEVVTVTFSNQGDVTYSSSVASHAPSIVYGNPTSCPNDAPAWFNSFILANQKGGAPLAKVQKTKNTLNHRLKNDEFIKKLRNATSYSVRP